MECEFCATKLPDSEPDNLALLQHLRRSDACEQQFEYLMENLGASWTPNMSGG